MSMYALQVMTGMEAEITRKLRGKGVDARCPQERRIAGRAIICGKGCIQIMRHVFAFDFHAKSSDS